MSDHTDPHRETDPAVLWAENAALLEQIAELKAEILRLEGGEYLQSIKRLTKDLKDASRTLSAREARFLVDAYYLMQRDRIRTAHQQRTLDQGAEPHDVIGWLFGQRETLEKEVAKALSGYSASHFGGRWARSIVGIGPIIAAGLLAHVYVGDRCSVCHGRDEKECLRFQGDKKRKHPEHEFTPMASCPTVGHVWRFAGLDPTVKWDRNTKRPWNGELKRLCFLIGESFTKVSNNENDIYGKVYRERKDLETERNEKFMFREQAEISLKTKNWRDDTQAKKMYEQGKLPLARIHLRAQRYAVKRFLCDFHCVLHYVERGALPPKPWVITHGGHVHYVPPQHLDLVPGMAQAFKSLPPPSRAV